MEAGGPEMMAMKVSSADRRPDAALRQKTAGRGAEDRHGRPVSTGETYTATYIVLPWRLTSSRVWSFELRMARSKSEVFLTGCRLTS